MDEDKFYPVLVSYPVSDIPRNATHGQSGIFAENWVISHGTILAPFMQHRELQQFLCNLSPGQMTPLPLKLKRLRELRFHVYSEKLLGTDDETLNEKRVEERPARLGRIATVWKCPLLEETLETLFSNWTFETSGNANPNLLPIFLCIVCEEVPFNRWETMENEENEELSENRRTSQEAEIGRSISVLHEISSRVVQIPRKGSTVELSWTPFGNPVFLNSVSRGVVSNILGTKGCLVITDANAFPGCEGGPVYAVTARVICGMVIAASVWHRSEPVDYTFAVNLAPSLNCILQNQGHLSPPALPNLDKRTIGTIERSIVVVRCGPTWGTGILIDRETGTFLTCAHVFAEVSERVAVVTRCRGQSKWSAAARLVYRTTEDKPYDVAVLTVNPAELDDSFAAIKFADDSPIEGEEVFSVGYPFFPSCDATISSGVVSKYYGCMLQTTCCIQSGASGGPIFRRSTQEMLGMAVCNVISSDGSVLYQRLSMAVPVNVLRAPLMKYLKSQDAGALRALTETDAAIGATWDLQPLFLTSRL